jgi:hypothetical protein
MGLSILMAALLAQTPAPLDVTVPTVAGVTADPSCGGRSQLTAMATCVVTTQVAVEGVIDVWNGSFAEQGWLPADGADNVIVYVKRRPQGGCDGMQILAFADGNVASPAAPAYLAIAAIPGDVCAAQPAPAAGPASPQ